MFRSMRMHLVWNNDKKPDSLFYISLLPEITDKTYHVNTYYCLKLLNSYTRYNTRCNMHLTFPKLDLATLHVLGYSDASFSNNTDLIYKLGFIIFLSDASYHIFPLFFRFYKPKRLSDQQWQMNLFHLSTCSTRLTQKLQKYAH